MSRRPLSSRTSAPLAAAAHPSLSAGSSRRVLGQWGAPPTRLIAHVAISAISVIPNPQVDLVFVA
ncbi:MAG: hypothetical protein Q6373_009475 [Candidatus Sigynarchaeota archaeon]